MISKSCSPPPLCRCQEGGSCYIVNATNWLGPLNVVEPLYGFLMPVLMCITFIFNSLIIIVLSRYMYTYTGVRADSLHNPHPCF